MLLVGIKVFFLFSLYFGDLGTRDTILPLQTVKGSEAQSAVKEEWQDFIKYFVVPLVESTLKKRVAAENAMATIPTYENSDDAAEKPQTLQEILASASLLLRDANRGLQKKLWSASKNVPPEAYSFTSDTPCFITMDNGPIHSFWEGKVVRGKHLKQPGVSLLQCIWISPHGHDLHQIIEHCNSFVKRKVRSKLYVDVEDCCGGGGQWDERKGCASIANSCTAFGRAFTAKMVDNNLPRLFNALTQVAAEKGKELRLIERDGREIKAYGTAGSYSFYN